MGVFLKISDGIQIYTNPPDTLHFCLNENTRLVVKGKDTNLYKKDGGKSGYSIPIHHESCYYIKEYLKTIDTRECTLSEVESTHFLYPIYQKSGCFLATNSLNDFDIHSKNILNYLDEKCSGCTKNSIIYSKLESSEESVYPIDTSHYCLNTKEIQVQGYDNIGFSSHKQSSKSQVGIIENYDSCYYIRQYFKDHMYSRCIYSNTTKKSELFYPIRNLGNCYVSASNVNITELTYNLIDYLKDSGCKGCLLGDYYIIDASAAKCNSSFSYKKTFCLICFIILIIENM